MAFLNAANASRVSKISDYLSLIAKSANSNKASTEEVADLLAPVSGVMATLVGHPAPLAPGDAPAAPSAQHTGLTVPLEEWRKVGKSLEDISDAIMAIGGTNPEATEHLQKAIKKLKAAMTA